MKRPILMGLAFDFLFYYRSVIIILIIIMYFTNILPFLILLRFQKLIYGILLNALQMGKQINVNGFKIIFRID